VYARQSFLIDFGAALAASVALHPIHFAEARWVLNNRLPNFNSYRSTLTMWYACTNQLARGITAHLPRSFLLSMTGYNYFNSVNVYNYIASMLCFHSL
jgi:hypothetical protein